MRPGDVVVPRYSARILRLGRNAVSVAITPGFMKRPCGYYHEGVRELRVASSRANLHSNSQRSRLVSIGSQPDPGRVQLCVLGRFELSVMNRPVAIPGPAQRVLALLGVEDQLLPRSFVAGTLWPDANEAAARSNLRSALWRLGSHRSLVLQVDPTPSASSAKWQSTSASIGTGHAFSWTTPQRASEWTCRRASSSRTCSPLGATSG